MTTKVPYPLLDQPQLKFADIASAATVNLDAALGAYGQITGTTNITAVTLTEGKVAWVRFTGILTLTHGASLVLPSGANITTAAGDWAAFVKISTVVYCIYYSKASGKAVNTAALAGDIAAINNSALPAGTVVAVSNTQTGAVNTGSTQIPRDDTIPQNTEGDQYMSLAHTPQNAANLLKIEVVWNGAVNASVGLGMALFKDSDAGALAATWMSPPGADNGAQLVFTHYMAAGGTSSITFKVRVGPCGGAGTVTFNGRSAARLFGDKMPSSITITEIKA